MRFLSSRWAVAVAPSSSDDGSRDWLRLNNNWRWVKNLFGSAPPPKDRGSSTPYKRGEARTNDPTEVGNRFLDPHATFRYEGLTSWYKWADSLSC